jgi:LysM repeat protein
MGKVVFHVNAFLGVLFFSSYAISYGQGDRVIIANLKQDMELINREVSGLRSEVELLRRENAKLRVVLDQLSRNQSSSQDRSMLNDLQNRLQLVELAQKQSDRARGSMQEEVNQKFQQIIGQMNQGFEQLTKINQPSTSYPEPTFSNDYPKNGFVHKVEKGETVSSIAQKYKSKVSWIIDANQITDPNKVFVGKELFVPLK